MDRRTKIAWIFEGLRPSRLSLIASPFVWTQNIFQKPARTQEAQKYQTRLPMNCWLRLQLGDHWRIYLQRQLPVKPTILTEVLSLIKAEITVSMHVSDHKIAIKRCRLDDLWHVDIVGGESVATEILSGPLEPFDIEYIATRSMASIYFEKSWGCGSWSPYAAVFQSSMYLLLHFYRRQLATNIFSISLGWQWKADSNDNPTSSFDTNLIFSRTSFPASSFSVRVFKDWNPYILDNGFGAAQESRVFRLIVDLDSLKWLSTEVPRNLERKTLKVTPFMGDFTASESTTKGVNLPPTLENNLGGLLMKSSKQRRLRWV